MPSSPHLGRQPCSDSCDFHPRPVPGPEPPNEMSPSSAFCTEHHDSMNPACLRGPSEGWAFLSPSQSPLPAPFRRGGARAASPDKGFLCKQNRLLLRLPGGQSTKGSSVKQGQLLLAFYRPIVLREMWKFSTPQCKGKPKQTRRAS